LERALYLRLRALADRREASRARRLGERPKPEHLLLGERGEDHAFFHLRSLGYKVVARRWVSATVRGDLDLVAWDRDTMVFVEVKTRSARDLFPAEAEVDRPKQRQLRRLALAFLAQLPARHRHRIPVRFDVLSVYLLPTGAQFEHRCDTFPLRSPIAVISPRS
jgi:putative endonuclease